MQKLSSRLPLLLSEKSNRAASAFPGSLAAKFKYCADVSYPTHPFLPSISKQTYDLLRRYDNEADRIDAPSHPATRAGFYTGGNDGEARAKVDGRQLGSELIIRAQAGNQFLIIKLEAHWG